MYQAFRRASFWIPVFFLYFLSLFGAERALLLEAIYFLAVVLLEIPSGYFSDRVGRRITLVLATLCGGAAMILFAITASFEAFVAAQVLMAASNAFNSGTDTSLLYDSLSDLGRESEFGEREGRALSVALTSAAGAALVGGLSAGIDLRLAYVASALAEIGALGVALRFAEPARHRRTEPIATAPKRVLLRLRDPALRWVFLFVVGMIVLNHVPYEFFQPYLKLIFAERDLGDYAVTPAISGVVVFGMMGIGAYASRVAMRVRARFGTLGSLLGSMVVQIGTVTTMAAVLTPWAVAAILLRSFPMGLLTPITNNEIHPRVETGLRATYLSVQSLAGRLCFSATLVLASGALTAGDPSHTEIAGVLWAYAAGGVALLVWLIATRPDFART